MGIDMQAVLSEASEVKSIGNLNGKEVLSFQDNNAKMKAETLDKGVNGKPPELGKREMKADGTGYKRTMTSHVAVDPNTLYENRYRIVGEGKDKKYEVVVDYRAIGEQANGNIYSHILTAYVVGKKGSGLAVEKTKTITAEEFTSEFIEKLDMESMTKVATAIAIYREGHGNVEKTGNKIDF